VRFSTIHTGASLHSLLSSLFSLSLLAGGGVAGVARTLTSIVCHRVAVAVAGARLPGGGACCHTEMPPHGWGRSSRVCKRKRRTTGWRLSGSGLLLGTSMCDDM
jgi:hypothetical protein